MTRNRLPGMTLVRRVEEPRNRLAGAVWSPTRLRKLGLVAIGGASLTIAGLAFASKSAPKITGQSPGPHLAAQVPIIALSGNSQVSVEAMPLSPDSGELEALRTRNRRLQALVVVLRERAMHP